MKPAYPHVQHRCERCEYGCIREEGIKVIDCQKVYWIPEVVVKKEEKMEVKENDN